VPTLEVLYQRLRGCKADQHGRIKLAPDARSWRAVLDTPRRWGINRSYRDICLFESLDDGRKWLPHFSREAEAWDGIVSKGPVCPRPPRRTRTEDGVHNVIGGLESRGEVFDEGDLEVLQLFGKSLRTR